MAVHISKIVGSIGGRSTPPTNIYQVESVATPASNTATAAYADGGWVIIFNGEAGAIKVAKGGTPDADATAQTADTSAYFVVAAGADTVPIHLSPGDKIEWKAA